MGGPTAFLLLFAALKNRGPQVGPAHPRFIRRANLKRSTDARTDAHRSRNLRTIFLRALSCRGTVRDSSEQNFHHQISCPLHTLVLQDVLRRRSFNPSSSSRSRLSVTRTLLEWLAPKLSRPRVIFDRSGNSPYLSRYYITGRPWMPDGSEPIDSSGNPRPGTVFPIGVHFYLHYFHRGDEDLALHSHPWRWSRSLILSGGYIEERRGPDDLVRRRVCRPWTWNKIDANDFHRVDLIEHDCWSLFIAGPKHGRSWGFWDRVTGKFLPWREFIESIRGPGWEGRK